MKKHYFPMFIDLSDKKVVVAGAGTIAKRRIRALTEFTDHLVVIAPEVNKELKDLEAEGKLTILRKHYEREDIYDASMVIAATNDKKLNHEIYTACKCLGIPVNVCSDKTKCDFYFPTLALNDVFVTGVSTSGRDPKKSRAVVQTLQEHLEARNPAEAPDKNAGKNAEQEDCRGIGAAGQSGGKQCS